MIDDLSPISLLDRCFISCSILRILKPLLLFPAKKKKKKKKKLKNFNINKNLYNCFLGVM